MINHVNTVDVMIAILNANMAIASVRAAANCLDIIYIILVH